MYSDKLFKDLASGKIKIKDTAKGIKPHERFKAWYEMKEQERKDNTDGSK